MNVKILCPYCNAEWTPKMETDLAFSQGSYTTGCIGSKIYGDISIYCDNCKKLIYKKEISQDYPYMDWEFENEDND